MTNQCQISCGAFWEGERKVIYYSKKVLHHLIFTKVLSNVLNEYTKHIFEYNTAVEGWTHCLTTINLCRNILLKSVKMHFSHNTEILGS